MERSRREFEEQNILTTLIQNRNFEDNQRRDSRGDEKIRDEERDERGSDEDHDGEIEITHF